MSSVTQRRGAVLAEVERAKAAGYTYNDWMGLALRLAELLPMPKAPAVLDRLQWADYKSPVWRQAPYEKGEFVVGFADGQVVKVSLPNDSRKPYNWASAARCAGEFWKNRMTPGGPGDKKIAAMRRLTAPKVVAMACNGQSLPAAIIEEVRP